MAILTSPYPISSHCPSCQANDYKTIKPETKVAFLPDRICAACGTRYTPPTPAWAAILFIVLGLLGSAVLLLMLLTTRAGPIRGGLWIYFGLVPCLLCVIYGIRSLVRKGR
jgi:hypothetical protein